MSRIRNALTPLAIIALSLGLAACDLGPKVSEQNGFRGTGMDQVDLVSSKEVAEVPAPPYALPAAVEGAQTAGEAYENVQVLADVSFDEFNYTMAALTEWVSPEQGCNYCHNPANMASDEVYTKVVARRMIQMTQNINANWGDHVGNTGVTCWTCHAGNNIPVNYWSMPEPGNPNSIAGNRRGQNEPTQVTAMSSLPQGAIAKFLLTDVDPANVLVASTGMHPSSENTLSTMETEQTYSVMMHMSQSLGVNCTYCHNTGSFGDWSMSTPARETAWYGIRMVRNMNREYITTLASVFPDNRLGAMGDPFKVNCTTCHQGLNKPMGGAQMAADYPALRAAPAPRAVPVANATREDDDSSS